MERVPQLSEFLTRGEQVEPAVGMRDLPGFFRKPWGEGWALAGDAAYHKHSLSAQGITDAFRDADLLGEAIDAGLSGSRDLSDALGDYERQWSEAVLPMYESTWFAPDNVERIIRSTSMAQAGSAGGLTS